MSLSPRLLYPRAVPHVPCAVSPVPPVPLPVSPHALCCPPRVPCASHGMSHVPRVPCDTSRVTTSCPPPLCPPCHVLCPQCRVPMSPRAPHTTSHDPCACPLSPHPPMRCPISLHVPPPCPWASRGFQRPTGIRLETPWSSSMDSGSPTAPAGPGCENPREAPDPAQLPVRPRGAGPGSPGPPQRPARGDPSGDAAPTRTTRGQVWFQDSCSGVWHQALTRLHPNQNQRAPEARPLPTAGVMLHRVCPPCAGAGVRAPQSRAQGGCGAGSAAPTRAPSHGAATAATCPPGRDRDNRCHHPRPGRRESSGPGPAPCPGWDPAGTQPDPGMNIEKWELQKGPRGSAPPVTHRRGPHASLRPLSGAPGQPHSPHIPSVLLWGCCQPRGWHRSRQRLSPLPSLPQQERALLEPSPGPARAMGRDKRLLRLQ